MIFYFSGTGNSRYAAETVGKAIQDTVVEMTADVLNGDMRFEICAQERVGFVFPVYWYGLPTQVIAFVKKLQLIGYTDQYIYTIVTYGGSAGQAPEELAKLLKAKGMPLAGKFGVKMVDNYVIAFNTDSAEEQKKITADAKQVIADAIPRIRGKEAADTVKRGGLKLIAPVFRPLYTKANRSKKFWVQDSCTGCGKCERDCPCKAIVMKDGRPSWEGDCTQCLRCIHLCPAKAIQYGKGTENRERYCFKED